MESYYVDSYNYCNEEDAKKAKFYSYHVSTEEEKIKTEELMKKLEEFIIKTEGNDALKFFHSCTEGKIRYRDGIGYISIVNPDRDYVIIYGYGKTVEEAFLSATIDYEFYVCERCAWANRLELYKLFSERFLDGNYSRKDYYVLFFSAELALQEFRKYYGDNMPEEIINYYENRLQKDGFGDYKYDYDTNRLVKRVEKAKTYNKK